MVGEITPTRWAKRALASHLIFTSPVEFLVQFNQAKDMEALETAILKEMGIGDPYE